MTWRLPFLLVGVWLIAGGALDAQTEKHSPPTAQPATRFWVDVSGKHSVHAVLIETHGEIVYLQKPDGRIATVPIRRLGNADREYVQSLHTDYLFVGKVVGVSDADTFTMLGASNQQLKIRLEGIDAPESSQAFGTKAKQALGEKVFGKSVTVEWRETDRYGRFLGHALVNGKWINKELIDEGWAWHYKEYNDSAVLADAESKAKAAGVGLWGDKNPTPPWVFRQPPEQPRAPRIANNTDRGNWWATDLPARNTNSVPVNSIAAAARPATNKEVVYVTKSGSKYHSAGCRHLSKSSIPMPLDEAANRYSPCSVCHPPLSNATHSESPLRVTTSRPSNDRPATTGYNDRNPHGESITGRTATGIPTFTGPRGGRYHYSKSGKKVYERKK